MSRALTALALACAVGLSLLASACGGSADNSVARVGSTPTTTSHTTAGDPRSASGGQALVAFTTCMRRHGVSNFPDPKADSNGYHLRYGPENGIDVRSPLFKNAQHACMRLLPNPGTSSPRGEAAQLQAALKFAACIRVHGVPNFPDPKLSRSGNLEMGSGTKSSVDPSSPRFKAAAAACQHLLPGSTR
jgi:hypothetical protein